MRHIVLSRFLLCVFIGITSSQATLAQLKPLPNDSQYSDAEQTAVNKKQVKGFDWQQNGYTLEKSTAQGFETAKQPIHWQDSHKVLVVTAPFINVRTFAGRGYPIFHVLEKNDNVYLHKRRNDWFKIETIDGKIGWIARNAIRQGATLNTPLKNIPLNIADKHWKTHHNHRFELGLSTGSFDGSVAYTPYMGYHLTSSLQVELNYSQAFGNFSNVQLASLNILHTPFPDWRVSPFFKLGSGFIKTNPSTIIVQSTDRQDGLMSVGGGLFFYSSSRLVLRAEYNKHTILTNRNVNEEVEEWKAGFGVLF